MYWHSRPQPPKWRGNTTMRQPGWAGSVRVKRAPGMKASPHFSASVWARTTPATEQSSVSASAW